MARKSEFSLDRDPKTGAIIQAQNPFIKAQEDVARERATASPVAGGTRSGGIPEVIRNEKGGVVGLKTPAGDTLLGLTDKQARDMLAIYTKQQAPIAGTVEAQTAELQRGFQKSGAKLAADIGNFQVNPEDIEAFQPDLGRTLGAGVTGAIGGVVQGAAGGALLGSAGAGVGAVPGALAGAGIGAIGGIYSGAKSSIATQLAGEISSGRTVIERIQTNLGSIVTDTNQNPNNAAENLQMFNAQLKIAEEAYIKLQKEVKRDVNQFLDKDATEVLVKFELFYAAGGQKDFFENQMTAALMNPDPTKLLLSNTEIEAGPE